MTFGDSVALIKSIDSFLLVFVLLVSPCGSLLVDSASLDFDLSDLKDAIDSFLFSITAGKPVFVEFGNFLLLSNIFCTL